MKNELRLLVWFIGCMFVISAADERVSLRTVKGITFHKGMPSSSRRLQVQQQLNCVGSTCDSINTVRCARLGTSGPIRWRCSSPDDPQLVMTDAVVTCEGYDGPADEFILKGSCSLQIFASSISDESLNWVGIVTSCIAAWMVWSSLRGAAA